MSKRRSVGMAIGFIGAATLTSCSHSSSSSPSTDWPMFGGNLLHTFTQTNPTIDSTNVAKLTTAWTFPVTDAVSASPSVANGVVYVGAWDGFFYALDATTGALKWKFQLDCQNGILPIPSRCLGGMAAPDRTGTDGGLVTSSATVIDGHVYFGGGRTLYCLNVADGTLVWKHVICGNPDDSNCQNDAADPTNIFSSPTVFDGKVIFGHTPDGATGYRGGINALDASTGAVVWTFEVDPIMDANGNVTGANNRGCGSVWSSGAVDDQNGLVIFGTGDCQADATPPYHEAVIALDIASGKPRWVYRPRTADTCDYDFGASANIVDVGGARYVGIGGKDGTYYMLAADTTNPAGDLLWSKNVVFGGSSGGFIGTAAFDGQHILGGTGIGGLGDTHCAPNDPRDSDIQDPSFHAFDAKTGNVVWEGSKEYTFAATSVAGDVIFSGVGSVLPAALRAYNIKDGSLLASFPQPGAVNSGAALSGKMVFFGTGNSFDGSGGAVVALKLP
jgi:polyvinyl alcohol dehydrogenase (cytochrome)